MKVLEKPAKVTEDNKPKYRILVDRLRQQIQSRELLPGDALPTYAEMRSLHEVTISTLDRVYGILEQEGLIERQQGRGTFVAEQKRPLTGNIGLIGSNFESLRRTPFFTPLYEGIQQSIESNRQHLLHLGTKDSWHGQRCDQVDGILICNMQNPKKILPLIPEWMPKVSLIQVIDGLTCIAVDDYRGTKMAIEHLWKLGHRRISCLVEDSPLVIRHRLRGYHDAMLDMAGGAMPEWARIAPVMTIPDQGQSYIKWGKAQMEQWLRAGWHDLQCTAILVQNEAAAIGVMQVLQKEGIEVPREVSVMGFDGTELCEYSTPTLCAVKIPLYEMGARAIDVLNSQIQGEPDAMQSILFPLQIREGDSVRPL